MGEDILLESYEIDYGEFEALGGVEGHEGDGVVACFCLVEFG